MVPRHIGTGHAARHMRDRMISDMEETPMWEEGTTDVTKDGRVFKVAPPAKLNDYQRSLVG
jgi:hypothetical protein